MLRYCADEKTEKDPQNPFINVTKSARRKFLQSRKVYSMDERGAHVEAKHIPHETEMSFGVVILLQLQRELVDNMALTRLFARR